MTIEFKLPDIGEGLAEAEVGKWLVRPGDTVKAEQPFVEIETEKVTVEIPAPQAARVVELRAQEGEVVPIGAVLCVFEPLKNGAAIPLPDHPVSPSPRPSVSGSSPPTGEVLALPAVRQRAKELGLDLTTIVGTGPAGRIVMADVERASSAQVAPAQLIEERIPLRGARRRIAQKMMQSLRHTAQASYGDEVDVTELVRLREEAKAVLRERGVHLTYLPYVIKAVVRGLQEGPHLNAIVDDDAGEIIVKREYNLGIAVHSEHGLVVPVVMNADQKSLTALAREVQHLVTRARAGRLTLEELRHGTFTLTNPGIVGGLFSTPILNYPEVGILAMHKIVKRPFVFEGEIAVRDVMNLALTFDHRIIDGIIAARFVQTVKRLLEAPGLLLLDEV